MFLELKNKHRTFIPISSILTFYRDTETNETRIIINSSHEYSEEPIEEFIQRLKEANLNRGFCSEGLQEYKKPVDQSEIIR